MAATLNVRPGVLLPAGKTPRKEDFETTIKLTAAGQQPAQLVGHQASVTALAFSPDAKMLASASDDKTMRLWDVATSRERHRWGERPGVAARTFSADGTVLASGSTDGTVRLDNLAKLAKDK